MFSWELQCLSDLGIKSRTGKGKLNESYTAIYGHLYKTSFRGLLLYLFSTLDISRLKQTNAKCTLPHPQPTNVLLWAWSSSSRNWVWIHLKAVRTWRVFTDQLSLAAASVRLRIKSQAVRPSWQSHQRWVLPLHQKSTGSAKNPWQTSLSRCMWMHLDVTSTILQQYIIKPEIGDLWMLFKSLNV